MGLPRVRHDFATKQQNILSLQIVNNKVLIFQSIQKTHFLVIFPVFGFSVSSGSIIENYIKLYILNNFLIAVVYEYW